MYPSPKNPSYGVFVSNFALSFQDGENHITGSTLIKGRKKGLGKFFSYCWFFIEVFWKSNFGKYDLIYVHYIQHSLLPLKFWWNKGDRKLVLNVHGTDIMGTGKSSELIRKLNRKLILAADLVVIPSLFFFSKVQLLGVKSANIFVSPSGGVDPDNFYPEIGNGLKMKIGYFGRLDPGKGLTTLLDSFKTLSELTDLNLEIIGKGSLFYELKQKVEACNLSQKISFLGVLNQKEAGEKLRDWDALIFPSELQESLGLVGLEAMACGIPVIGTRQGGILTYLENCVNGFTFEPGNSKELTEAIISFYKLDKEARDKMSDEALRTAVHYLKPKVFARLNDQLNTLFNA